MNEMQKNAAKEEMINWLSHPQELGKAPAKIECAKEFDLHDMHYYIFKYKKNMLGKWLLGVCGGYEDDSTEHCGHVFSDMKEYNDATAIEDATALVEMIRSYWMEQAQKAEKEKESSGNSVNFVLLKEAKFDKDAVLRDLKAKWQIEDETDEQDDKSENDGSEEDRDDTFVINYHGVMISVALILGPIPGDEVEYHARNNYMWPEGVETVSKHQAHLLVIAFNTGASKIEAGKLLVKTVVSCCNTSDVLGVYANGVVYQPSLYLDFAKMLDKDDFPVFNLIWFGLYNGKNGVCGYTCGMRHFGYDEIEVIDSSATPQEIANFITGVASYVILDDVLLKDGETIGFSAEQKLPITKSRGIAVEGDSLKIAFP